MNKELCIKVG